MKSLWKLCWLEKNINSKIGKEFNFPKYKLFKQAEVLISHLLFISVNSSVILTKTVEINMLPTDSREKSMHSFLTGHKIMYLVSMYKN